MSIAKRLLLLCPCLSESSRSPVARTPRARRPRPRRCTASAICRAEVLSSLVRDATRGADGALYAVGGSGCASNQPVPCGSPDTAMVWRFDGTTATRVALPDLVPNTAGNSNLTAYDITADAAYIASQARSAPNGPNRKCGCQPFAWTGAFPPSASANLNLALTRPAWAGPSLFPTTEPFSTVTPCPAQAATAAVESTRQAQRA